MHLQRETVDTGNSCLARDGAEPPVGIGPNLVRPGRAPFASGSIGGRPDRVVSAPHGERLDFGQLIGELSMRFIDLVPSDVDAAIQEAQRCIVEALDLDGSTLFELGEDGDLLQHPQLVAS